MSAHRYRLRHVARDGKKGAVQVQALLDASEHLQSLILLSKILLNAAIVVIVVEIMSYQPGANPWGMATSVLLVSFCLLIFSEILPKTIGVAYSHHLVVPLSYIFAPLQRAALPLLKLLNRVVRALLDALPLEAVKTDDKTKNSPEDLRAMVRDAGHLIPQPHQDMLLKLFDLENIQVDDIMKPRGEIEAIDLAAPIEELRQQLATSFHTRLLVYENEPDNVLGVLHQRRLLAACLRDELDHQALRSQLSAPYFIPSGTPLYAQLQFFQENLKHIGLVVDEYGELLGLIALEDIIEEILGKFATRLPGNAVLAWQAMTESLDTVMVDGARTLRELNRVLGLDFPLDGPKTLNGLIVEHLQDIPEAGLSLRIGKVTMEIVQTQDRRVRMVRLFKPAANAHDSRSQPLE